MAVEKAKGEIAGIRVSMGMLSELKVLKLATVKARTESALGKSTAEISFGL